MTLQDPRAVVARKRDGESLSPDDIQAFVEGYVRGEVTDALAAAFLMACVLRGMDDAETLALTRTMIDSGETVLFGDLGRPIVDKHSTGGVADGVTLAFVPLAAALDLAVAKLSGRGLGHTGGTLDKLESIPGQRTDLSPSAIERQVADVGCAVAAQSPNLVPADGALYALRDATATVPSIPLIAASVMSKKLAVQTDLILLDVKSGSGAFMKSSEAAGQLAEACLRLAQGWGRRACAAVTDMSQPLGDAVGNALDIVEAVELLRGDLRGRLRDLAVLFAARALEITEGVARPEAISRAERAIDNGHALERFRRMIEAQGGDPHVVDDPHAILPKAAVVLPILPERAGTLAAMETEEIGLASGALGAGRTRKGEVIDPAVGIVVRCKIGDLLAVGDQIGEVHARSDDDARIAIRRVLAALSVVEGRVTPPPLVDRWIDDTGDDWRSDEPVGAGP